MSKVEVESAIARALDFLHRSQKPSGEFPYYRFAQRPVPRKFYDSSPFPTALIASSLEFCDSPLAKPMIDRACALLRSQMERFGVWRYWPGMPVLPDLDDTAVVSHLLRRNGVKIPNNRGIFLANRNRAGLFHTWIVPRPVFSLSPGYWWAATDDWRKPHGATELWKTGASPNDLDGIVNSNILSCLGAGPKTEPIWNYLIGIFKNHQEETCDRWYQNRFTFYCAVARNYREGVKALGIIRDEMIERISSSSAPDGLIGSSAMDTAHAACALLSLDSDAPALDAAINYLVRTQGPDGQWPYAFYYYGAEKERVMCWGSEELTTGFCLQALCRYARRAQA